MVKRGRENSTFGMPVSKIAFILGKQLAKEAGKQVGRKVIEKTVGQLRKEVTGNKRRVFKRKSVHTRGLNISTKALHQRLKKIEKAQMYGERQVHNINLSQHTHGENTAAYSGLDVFHDNDIEDEIDNLPFLDTSTASGGSVNNFNVKAVGQSHKINVKNIYAKITVRNNGLTPVFIDQYFLRAMDATTTTPVGAMTAEHTQKGYSGTITDLIRYPSEYSMLTGDVWKIVQHAKVYLQAGDEINFFFKDREGYAYDPEEFDARGSPTYNKGAIRSLIRTYGPVGHGLTTASQLCTVDGLLDIRIDKHWTITWPSNLAFKEKVGALSGETPTVADPVVAGQDVELIQVDT